MINNWVLIYVLIFKRFVFKDICYYYTSQMRQKRKAPFAVSPKNRKHVMCYCSECLGRKQVDPRTKRNHESRYLPGSDLMTSNVTGTRSQSDSNPSNIATHIQSGSGESEDSRNSDSDIDDGRADSVFEDEIASSPISTHLLKEKFKAPPSNIAEGSEVNFENDSLSSDQDENDSLSSNSEDTPFNFNTPQIDPETFDPPIQFDEGQLNEWVVLWLMKFQKQFNLPNTGFDALVKFIRRVFQHYDIEDADRLPTSIFTAKSSLGFSMKYREYAMCPECYTLYNPTELKNYKEDGQPSVMKCEHVEFPYHRSKR